MSVCLYSCQSVRERLSKPVSQWQWVSVSVSESEWVCQSVSDRLLQPVDCLCANDTVTCSATRRAAAHIRHLTDMAWHDSSTEHFNRAWHWDDDGGWGGRSLPPAVLTLKHQFWREHHIEGRRIKLSKHQPLFTWWVLEGKPLLPYGGVWQSGSAGTKCDPVLKAQIPTSRQHLSILLSLFNDSALIKRSDISVKEIIVLFN